VFCCYTAPVWNRVLVLVAGAVLAPGKRTVTLGEAPQFRRYHEVLGRARRDGRAVARRLLLHVLDRLLPRGAAVIGIDDTIERRWGALIKARGIYRDPVRSYRVCKPVAAAFAASVPAWRAMPPPPSRQAEC
jgi:hypothetical protein